MLVAAELTLAGNPAFMAPGNWPGYDLIAQPTANAKPQVISVKSRTFKKGSAFFRYCVTDRFDWLALVIILPGDTETKHRIFVIPRDLANKKAHKNKPPAKSVDGRYWRIAEVEKIFAPFEGNFSLRRNGRAAKTGGALTTKGTKP